MAKKKAEPKKQEAEKQEEKKAVESSSQEKDLADHPKFAKFKIKEEF